MANQSAAGGEAGEDARPLRSRLWRWSRILVALVLVAGVVVVARPGDLWRTLRGASYGWVALAVPLVVVSVFLDAFRLHCLMTPHGFSAGLRSVLRTNLVVNCVSVFLPGTVGGGAVAWYRLSRPDNLRAQTFAALALNTVLKLVVVSGLGAVALAFDATARGAYQEWIAPLALLAAAPFGALALMLWTPATPWVKAMHQGFFSRFLPRFARDAILKILESFETYRGSKRSVLGALLVGFGSRLILNLAAYYCLVAVGGGAGYARLLWIMCATEAAAMMPFTLSGWGMPQVAYVGLLGLTGVAPDVALASHVAMWVAMLPVYLAGAGILLREARRP